MNDVTQTTEAIIKMAETLEEGARALRRTAASMVERKDLTYAAQAASIAANLLPNLRLDLLVTRPLRAAGIK